MVITALRCQQATALLVTVFVGWDGGDVTVLWTSELPVKILVSLRSSLSQTSVLVCVKVKTHTRSRPVHSSCYCNFYSKAVRDGTLLRPMFLTTLSLTRCPDGPYWSCEDGDLLLPPVHSSSLGLPTEGHMFAGQFQQIPPSDPLLSPTITPFVPFSLCSAFYGHKGPMLVWNYPPPQWKGKRSPRQSC